MCTRELSMLNGSCPAGACPALCSKSARGDRQASEKPSPHSAQFSCCLLLRQKKEQNNIGAHAAREISSVVVDVPLHACMPGSGLVSPVRCVLERLGSAFWGVWASRFRGFQLFCVRKTAAAVSSKLLQNPIYYRLKRLRFITRIYQGASKKRRI